MAYLAGPPVMVEAATAWLAARGLAQRQIHADAFYNQN
jgi:CDP-4-dehydro-6-deoxyglucose reductase/ferredoxin-NAD(P)+ reductase (naphthalene dioxygenase ferredoxin-specific)